MAETFSARQANQFGSVTFANSMLPLQLLKKESGTSDVREVPDLDWWAVKDSSLGPAD